MRTNILVLSKEKQKSRGATLYKCIIRKNIILVQRSITFVIRSSKKWILRHICLRI